MNNPDKIFHAFERFYSNLIDSASNILPGILLVLISLLVAFILSFMVRILVKAVRLDHWLERTNTMQVLGTIGIKPHSHIFIGKVFFWIIFLILLEAVAEVSGWTSITNKFNEYILLIPLMIGAIVIVAVGLFLSRFIRDAMRGILTRSGSKAANIISNITFYALLAMTATIALGYVGVETSIISANISIILGSILLSFSLAFVFASRELLTNILSSSYNKTNYKIGQKVSVDGSEGEIIKITNISVFIKTATKIKVVPARKFTDEIVEILG